LKDSGSSSGQARKHERIRAILVVSEVALACVLLVGAGLLLRSFLKVLDVDLGFQPERAAAVKMVYDDSAPTDDQIAAKLRLIFQRTLERVSSLPGVEAAGIVDYLPLGQNRNWGTPAPRGRTYPPGAVPAPLVYVITPGYFRAMGMRLRGRDFTWDDGPHSDRVVLINAACARTFWPDEDAVGKVLVSGGNELHVVGVVDDIRAESVEGQQGWQIYYPATQQNPAGAELVVRTQLPPAALASSVMSALRELNPKQPAADFRPIQTLVDHAISPRRFFLVLVGSFAGLGLLLAALGIFGVISYSVTQRTQEIGIRMALGATMAQVQKSVLLKTLRLALIGIAAGAVVSLVVARAIAALLFATAPADPLTFAGMTLLLASVALVAGYLPARRASRINPMVALRNN
ncbi:MAG: FtsX-like permease family protein, partial [Terracidiphilus sp.]